MDVIGNLMFVPALIVLTYGVYRVLWAVFMVDYSKEIRKINKKRRKAAKRRGGGKWRTIGSVRIAGRI